MSSPDLPPGQTLTRKFPVTGEKEPLDELTTENWRLSITGEVEEPVSLTFADLLALPQEQLTADIHCVTSWSQRQMAFEGVRLSEVFQQHGVNPKPDARFVRFRAHSERKHDTSLPLPLALQDSWLIHRFEGLPLTPAHGFPVRVVTPSRYFYKSLKWLVAIELLAEDRLGFWERTSAYHNVGDPWKEQRFEGRKFTSREEIDRFRNLEDFAPYRDDQESDRVIVKADLRGWKPRTRDLRGLRFKACDFRDADLREADLSEANLTLGKFSGADLEKANLTGADLEGADFSGARLAGACLAANALSATVFHAAGGQGLATHRGLQVVSPQGLLESQEAYLKEIGALRV